MPPKKMVLKEDGTPDFGTLQTVVKGQLEADAKYDRENDAKFRAVKQRVATYEEFENIVLGAHLQPMEEDLTALDLKKTTKSTTGRSRDRERQRMKEAAAAAAAQGGGDKADPVTKPPKDAQAFTRKWRALKANRPAQCQYLLLTGAARLGHFFAAGADAVLGEALLAVDAGYSAPDAAALLGVLGALSGTARFALAVEFLSADERKAALGVLDHIARDAADARSGGGGGGGDTTAKGTPDGAEAKPAVDLELVSKLKGLFT
mmetsp:Transcript_25266/g.66007  ORF Transcript_25266/g.66007 Transcript_25266/m.66007 type:complete len:262 (-) Transcript_25266:2526-3311(-)